MKDDLRELLDRRPFEPIKARWTSGDTYEIRDPHSAAMMRNRLFVVVSDGARDRWSVVPYLHTAAVEAPQSA